MNGNLRTMTTAARVPLALFVALAGLAVLAAALAAAPAAGVRAAAPGPAPEAAPPVCSGVTATLTFDYRFATGSAAYWDEDGDPESGSTFRWLVNGAPAEAGTVAEGLLLHLDGSVAGVNGESPSRSQGIAYAPGHWGQALALEVGGALAFSPDNNLDLQQGTIELWAALRADGDDPVYSGTEHVLLYYAAPDGDWLAIAQAADSGVLYAGGEVDGQWQSAYGSLGTMRNWQAGEWHHLALAYSAAPPGSFIRFYVDGVLAADTNEGHYWPPAAGGAELTVGGTPWDETAYYYLDEVRLSGRAATPAEIASRAQRLEPPRPNEVWLATETLAPSTTLVYEYTPQDTFGPGEACSSTLLVYPGIPITNAQPPSTLLPPATTEISLTVQSTEPTTCAYALGDILPYDQMTPFAGGAGTITHTALVTGLNADPNALNQVAVRCAAHPDFLLPLHYRSLSPDSPDYPRKGNLWGWWGVEKGLPYASRIDLWLGHEYRPEQIQELRRLNPAVRVLTSMNTVEHNGLPDDYYLKDIHGNKIEVWPGVYRLNLTKLYVAEYQARYAYQLMLDGSLMYDGVFMDNVMTSQSWLQYDCWGNPVDIDSDEDGVEDDPAVLDANWKAGVVHELTLLRELLPHALLSGHSMDVYEPEIPGFFNGVSIGFWTADVIEGKMTFGNLWNRYNTWHQLARQPTITMIESAPPDQIAYGYDYSPWAHIPPSTLEFARTYYPYVRFGLALTLMNDGYFAHEYGDTWHGNDWWYDELDFNLGQPLGPAEQISLGAPPPVNQLENAGFEASPAVAWAGGPGATLAQDSTHAAAGRSSLRLDATGRPGQVALEQGGLSVEQGVGYDVSFWIRSERPQAITVTVQTSGPDPHSLGLAQSVPAGPEWQRLTLSFDAAETAAGARLQFLARDGMDTIWLDDVWLAESLLNLYRREFERGLVVLNGTRQVQTVHIEPGFRRLVGSQAPQYETILDDVQPGFTFNGTWTEMVYDTGEWTAVGPFYHDWAAACHERSGSTGEADWVLPVTFADVYTITAWWPAAPAAAGWSSHVVYEVIANGEVLTSTVMDQRTGGDEWHLVGAVEVGPGQSAHVRMTCEGEAPCIADALHVRSRARYNDGSPAELLQLQPMDGIVLRREFELVYLPVVYK